VVVGAAYGAVAWGAYAVVEQGLSVWWPLVAGWNSRLASGHWQVIATVVGLFLGLGLVVGALVVPALEALARTWSKPGEAAGAGIPRALATGTLTAAFAVNQATAVPFAKAEAFGLAISCALTLVAGAVAFAGRRRWPARFSLLTNPWVASCLLLAGGWTGRRVLVGGEAAAQLGVTAVAMLAIAGIGALARAVVGRRVEPEPTALPVRSVVGLVLAGSAIFGTVAAVRPRTPALPAAGPRAAGSGPNVVLIVLDAVRADHLTSWGYERDTAPTLARLAGRATLYTNAFSPGAITLTSHASLFTGRYGSRHRAHLAPPRFPLGRPLDRSRPTLAGALAEYGYLTLAEVANYGHLGPGFGLERGFAVYDVRRAAIVNERVFLRRGVLELLGPSSASAQIDLDYARADEVSRAAAEMLGRARLDGRRFFLFLSYMDAHEPYTPPPPFDDAFSGRDRRLHYRHFLEMRSAVEAGSRAISPSERTHFVSQYDGAISFMDAQVALVLARLERLGLYDDTMIVVTSDHGEALGDRNLVGHGSSVYQDQIHVPLIIKFPHQREPRVVGAPVSHVDIMPTVLRAVGATVPAGADGIALQNLDEGGPRWLLAESFPHGPAKGRFDRIERAIVAWPWKLITSTAGKRELYDLSRDPDERSDVLERDGPTAQALEAALAAWLRTLPHGASDESAVDPDAVRRLRSLGYID
jgi:arylsulfatase A-like enzyme